ncbi:MAG: NUDIX hydrolase [Candidatus Saccharimonadales bacterium]
MNEACYYRVSVKGIVVDQDGRVLLSKESDGSWEMLGGGLEHGEDAKDGLRREILEETGLEVTKISAQPRFFLTAPRRNRPDFVANVVYEIELANLDFKPSDECQELRFFSVEEMAVQRLFPNVEALQKLLLAERDGQMK